MSRYTGKSGLRVPLALVIMLIAFSLAYVSFSARIASAEPTGPSQLYNISSSRGNISSTVKTVAAEAGNVTELNLTANTVTKAWQGYFGNVTGRIVLQNSLGNSFYTWNNSLMRGEIYASRSAAVNWATINCTNSTGMNQENAYLGNKLSTDPDSVNNTFTSRSHPPVDVGSVRLSNCWSTQAYGPSGGPSGQNFWNILLSDAGGNGSIVYTTIINKSTTGFRNVNTDFELLVGENGNATSAATTTYYFYVELD